MRSIRHSAFLIVAIALCGCASSGGGSSTPQGAGAPARRDPNVITEQELSTTQEENAFGAVQQLRPQMLVTRGTGSMNLGAGVVVFQDGHKLGDVTTLRQITLGTVKEIRYLSASDATMRFGTGVSFGAIVVTSK